MQNYSLNQQKASGADQVGDMPTTMRAQSNDQIKIDRSVKILELRNFQSVQHACEDALTNNKFVGISGDPGLGKTTALRYFAEHNPNVFLITASASMTVRDFWTSVFEAIYNKRVDVANKYGGWLHKNLDDDTASWDKFNELEAIAKESQLQMTNIRNNPNIHFIIKQIIKNMNATGGLLILDEGGKFKTTRFLEMLHELRDATMDRAGILIAGPEYFKRQLQVWVNKSINGIPELWSRIQYWMALDIPAREDIKEFCHAYGVTNNEVIKELQTTRNYRLLYHKVIAYLEAQAEEQAFNNEQ